MTFGGNLREEEEAPLETLTGAGKGLLGEDLSPSLA